MVLLTIFFSCCLKITLKLEISSASGVCAPRLSANTLTSYVVPLLLGKLSCS